jgi:hypothetical protein
MAKRPQYHRPQSPEADEAEAKVSASTRQEKMTKPHAKEAEDEYLRRVAAFLNQLQANLKSAGVDEATQDLVAKELYDEKTGTYRIPLVRAADGAAVIEQAERDKGDPDALMRRVVETVLELARAMPAKEKARAHIAEDEAKKERDKKAFKVSNRGSD